MISGFLIEVLKVLEEFKPRAYKDAVGKWTVGYGHVIQPNETFGTLIEEDAAILLRSDAKVAFLDVNEACIGLQLLPHEVEALTSFTFNVGGSAMRGSTLLKLLKAGDRHAAAWEFQRWCFGTKAGKKVRLPGLVRRRHTESVWFLGASWQTVLYVARGGEE